MSVIINGTTGITSPGGDTAAADDVINGLTVGKGAGAVATNVVVGGNGSLGGGSQTGTNNTALGDRTLTANTSGSYNTAVGQGAVYLNTTGGNNTGVGSGALQQNTTGVGAIYSKQVSVRLSSGLRFSASAPLHKPT